MAVNGVEIKVGQVWETRCGREVRVLGYDCRTKTEFVWDLLSQTDRMTLSVNDLGHYLTDKRHDWDLIRLVKDVPAEAQPIDVTMPEVDDGAELAVETLQALGWHFNGKAWVQDRVNRMAGNEVQEHPLYAVYIAAIEQAMYGKGERHGGAVTPFTEQPWVHYAKMHGRGFLTGQSAKKLEEAASTREGEKFETEVLGAIVYAGMAVLKERGEV